jgi:hypothetical protein
LYRATGEVAFLIFAARGVLMSMRASHEDRNGQHFFVWSGILHLVV